MIGFDWREESDRVGRQYDLISAVSMSMCT